MIKKEFTMIKVQLAVILNEAMYGSDTTKTELATRSGIKEKVIDKVLLSEVDISIRDYFKLILGCGYRLEVGLEALEPLLDDPEQDEDWDDTGLSDYSSVWDVVLLPGRKISTPSLEILGFGKK